MHVIVMLTHLLQVFQRQMSKEGLQAVVNGSDAAGGGWSSEELRDLFTLRQDTASDTYDSSCRPKEDDLAEEADSQGSPGSPQYKQQASSVSDFCWSGSRCQVKLPPALLANIGGLCNPLTCMH